MENIEQTDPELHRLLCWKIEKRHEIAEIFDVDNISVGEKDILVRADGRLHRFTKAKQFKTWRKLRYNEIE